MRRAPAQCGRAALAWAGVTFLALQLSLAIAIERWLPELRDPMYAVKLRLLSRRTTTPSRPPTVVMIGSSRVECGLRGQSLEQQLAAPVGSRPVVFNFGISGAGCLTELVIARRLIAEGIRPNLMLIEVLPPTLAAQTGSSELARLTPERLWLDDLPLVARYGKSLSELREGWWEAWPVPWYSHRYAILSRMAPVFLPGRVPSGMFNDLDESGVGPPTGNPRSPEAYRRNVEQAINAYAPCFKDFALGGASAESLRELLELCRRERIPTALVLMPEGTEFREIYTPDAWTQIQTYLRGLSREFDAPLINAREWVPDDEFADTHHLLLTGANRFTERLGRDHLAAMLAGARSARR